jgi:ankyrin repeat protein
MNELDAELFKAVAHGNSAECERLLDAGADIESIDGHRCTPLMLAIELGHNDLCVLLLKRGADAFDVPEKGSPPLHRAAQDGNMALCKLLLAHGVGVDQRTAKSATPLHAAAFFGQEQICLLLLQEGADATACDNLEYSPLDYAVAREHLEACLALRAHDARSPPISPALNKLVRRALALSPLEAAIEVGAAARVVHLLESETAPQILSERLKQSVERTNPEVASLVRSHLSKCVALESMREF